MKMADTSNDIMTTLPQRKRWKLVIPISFALLILFNTFTFFFMERLIKSNARFPFDTDEAAHALSAQSFAADLVQLDLRQLKKDFYRSAFYPPVGALLKAPMYIFFGVSNYSARIFSLVCLSFSTIFIYMIGVSLNRSHGYLAGLIASAFTLSSIGILLPASMSMLELPGMLVSMFTLWIYLRSLSKESWFLNVALGCALAAVMLTKYPYGLVIIATITGNELVELVGSKQLRWRRWLLIFLPLILVLSYWFWEPWKIRAFLGYSAAQPHSIDFATVENFLYYPKTLYLHYFPSALISVLGFGSFIWAALHFREKYLRVIFLFFLAGFAILTVESLKNIRFIAPFVPALFLLTSSFLIQLWQIVLDAKSNLKLKRWAFRAATLALFAFTSISAHGKLKNLEPALQVTYETDPQLLDAEEWIISQTKAGPVCVVEPWDSLSVFALQWTNLSRDPQKIRHPKVLEIKECEIRDDGNIVRTGKPEIRADPAFLVVLIRSDSTAHKSPLLNPTFPLVASRTFEYEWFWDLFAHDLSPLTRDKLRALKLQKRNVKSLKVDIYKL